MEKVRINSWTGPEPAFIGGPEPDVVGLSGMGIEPTEISMIQPTVGVGEEGPKPRGGAPSTGSFG